MLLYLLECNIIAMLCFSCYLFVADKKWWPDGSLPEELPSDFIQVLTDEETAEAVGKAKNEGSDNHTAGTQPSGEKGSTQSKADMSCTIEDEHKSHFFDTNQSSNVTMAQAGQNVGLTSVVFRTSNTFDSIYRNKFHWSMSHPELFPYGRGKTYSLQYCVAIPQFKMCFKVVAVVPGSVRIIEHHCQSCSASYNT